MNYQETLDYLYKRLPMYQRVGGQAFKKDLTNTLKACHYLNNPQSKFKSIHIAGTNGKGSVSHMLAAVLQSSGYKTGLYTSPHLKDFRERIKVNGEMVPEEYVVNFTAEMMEAIEEIQPSFFELTVAMAFKYFADQKVDIACIETGLGGRLDSTNVINPEISVITNIDLEHQAFLGDSLQAIAAEKAGIIKKNIPVVIGRTQAESRPVFEQIALKQAAEIQFADQLYEAVLEKSRDFSDAACSIYKQGKKVQDGINCELKGNYQLENISTVFATIDKLKVSGFERITDESVKNALENVKSFTGLRGRWDKLYDKPLVIADIAHNPAALSRVVDFLKANGKELLHIVYGTVNDKDIASALQCLPENANYYFCRPDIPRGLDVFLLSELALANNRKGQAYDNVKMAYEAAKLAAGEDGGMVLVTGSAFVVAEVL